MPGLRGWLIRCNELGANENSNEPHPCRSSQRTRGRSLLIPGESVRHSPENLGALAEMREAWRSSLGRFCESDMGPRVNALSTELVQPPMMSEARAIGVGRSDPAAVAVHRDTSR